MSKVEKIHPLSCQTNFWLFSPCTPQLPQLCTYQQLTYTIVIEGASFIEIISPEGYTTANGLMVLETINSGLAAHTDYSITVTVTTVTGTVSTNATFSEFLKMNSPYIQKIETD